MKYMLAIAVLVLTAWIGYGVLGTATAASVTRNTSPLMYAVGDEVELYLDRSRSGDRIFLSGRLESFDNDQYCLRQTEESILDPRMGNFVTRSFAEYHVPVHLDIGEIETVFVEEEDKIVNKMGVKGIGEVGIVGVAAAVANAIFNATGIRVRELPVTPDKLL